MKSFRTIVCACLLITSINFSFSQKAPSKFGDISMAELKMTRYDEDSSAAAVVLLDYGVARVDINSIISMNFDRYLRIKVLKKEGVRLQNMCTMLLKQVVL